MNVTIKLNRKYHATVKVDAPDASAAIRQVLETYEALEPDGYYTLHCGDSLTTAYGDEFARTAALTAPKDASTVPGDAWATTGKLVEEADISADYIAGPFGIDYGDKPADVVEISFPGIPRRTSPFAKGGVVNGRDRVPVALAPNEKIDPESMRKILAPKAGHHWLPEVDYRELEARTLKFYEENKSQAVRDAFAQLEALKLAASTKPIKLFGTPTTSIKGDTA